MSDTADVHSRPARPQALRRGPPAQAVGPDLRRHGSDALCMSALHVYEEVFRHAPEFDPDMGLAESYDCGRRALLARLQVRPWRVPEGAARAVEQLFARVRSVPGDEVIEVIDSFPAGFLDMVDRRRRNAPSIRRNHRRWSDRLPQGVTIRMPAHDGH